MKIEIVKPVEKDDNKVDEEKKKEEEKKRKEKEEAEKKKKEEEEAERKRKEQEKKKKEAEVAERKRKAEEADKKKKEEEERLRKEKEEADKKKKEEEERLRKEKEEADKKKKEEEEKLRKEKEEADKKIREAEELEKKKKEEELLNKIKEEEEKKKLKDAEDKRKKEEEEAKRKKEEEERKKEEELRKQKEEEEKKKKEEEEELRKQKEEEEKRKKEEELRKQKEEEEKRKKEEEDERKRREEEEEEKRKKERENEEERRKEEEKKREEARKKLEEERDKLDAQEMKKKKENERPINKKHQKEKMQHNIADAMKKQIAFDKKIKNEEIKDDNFLITCSIINKEWFDKFIQLSNYEAFKEKLEKSPRDEDKIIKNALDDQKFEELKNLIQKKPEPITAQALEKIENLAFVDDDFVAKILSLGENNKESINSDINNSNINKINNPENQINNNNQISDESPFQKTKIMINKGAAVIQLSTQKYVCANIQDSNLNKRDNIEVIEFPKNQNLDLFKEIKNNKQKIGLREGAKQKYISSILQNQGMENPNPIMPNPNPVFQNPNPIMPNPNPNIQNLNPLNPNSVPNMPIPASIIQNPIQQKTAPPPIQYKPIIVQDYSLGLDNVGATCYMNATLQCLAHIKRVSERIIKYREDGEFKDVTKHRLSEVYSEVVNEIWLPEDKSKKSFAPNRFKKVLGEMNELFAPTAANDAKDLLIYFIEQMHTELNKSKEQNLNLIMPDDMNPTNLIQVRNCFFAEFTKKYKSVFSDTFYGSNLSVTLCHTCRESKFSYQCFSFIIFPLLEAKKNCVTSGRLLPFLYNTYILNIEDCFLYNQKIEFFTGSNQMYCNRCQASKDSSMWTRISTAPLVLILILNRGRGNLDFKEPFIFWEIIDLTHYLEFPNPDNKYFLAGVVSHMGDSGPSGHFIAFCRMSPNSKWYCYNDSLVNESSFQEINSRGTPYILFYQKVIIPN